MADDPDRDLVERCRSDDVDALRELLNRYAPAVFASIAQLTPKPERTEQLAHEVFLRIHRDLPYFRGEAPLETWILRTAVGVCQTAAADGTDPMNRGVRAIAPDVRVPPQFVPRLLTTFRRRRWRREQAVDIAFNVAIAAVGITTVGMAWYFVDATGIAALGRGTGTVLRTELAVVARNIAPSLPGYLAAIALLGGVLLAWWWAER
jgi:hypothetical protein